MPDWSGTRWMKSLRLGSGNLGNPGLTGRFQGPWSKAGRDRLEPRVGDHRVFPAEADWSSAEARIKPPRRLATAPEGRPAFSPTGRGGPFSVAIEPVLEAQGFDACMEAFALLPVSFPLAAMAFVQALEAGGLADAALGGAHQL